MAGEMAQLEALSQEQHRHYFELFGTSPSDGGVFADLGVHTCAVGETVQGVRAGGVGLHFSTAVTAAYAPATETDHVPFDRAARAFGIWATVTDDSRRINLDGAGDIAANARAEAGAVSAIPDPDSPAGQMHVLARIADHQGKAATLVERAAAAEQAAGARAADAGEDSAAPRVQALDNHSLPEEPPPPPKPPVQGLPPEGVRPPVEGPLTEGPASRPSARDRGGRSLYDQHGGEWRYYPGDEWRHNPHWDYKPRPGPGSDWDNIPIDGLPPISNPEIVAGLPPWLLDPHAASGPPVVLGPQNPLLAPFPGATMPAPPPAPAPMPGPSLIPHLNVPHVDVPPPTPGEGALAGGALLLLLLGSVVLA